MQSESVRGLESALATGCSQDMSGNDLESLAQLDEAGGKNVHVEEPANSLLE